MNTFAAKVALVLDEFEAGLILSSAYPRRAEL